MITEKEIIDTINSATDKFKELNGMLGVLLEVANDYYKRIDKAIEYIEHKQKLNIMFGYITLSKDSQKELLDILKGSDSNESGKDI